MNNLYRKIAVASVCTALSFALEPNKEVKAGPPAHISSFTSTQTFFIADTDGDGRGDSSYGGLINPPVGQSGRTEYRSFYIFNIAQLLTSPRYVERAEFWVLNKRDPTSHYGPSFQLEIYSYDSSGENIANPYQFFETGKYLDSTQKFSQLYSETFSFSVGSFVNEKLRNKSAFVGFGIRDTYNSKTSSNDEQGFISLQEKAHLNIIAPPAPVPEPTTIFGSAIGLYLGGWLKRKKSTLQNKGKSQA